MNFDLLFLASLIVAVLLRVPSHCLENPALEDYILSFRSEALTTNHPFSHPSVVTTLPSTQGALMGNGPHHPRSQLYPAPSPP